MYNEKTFYICENKRERILLNEFNDKFFSVSAGRTFKILSDEYVDKYIFQDYHSNFLSALDPKDKYKYAEKVPESFF